MVIAKDIKENKGKLILALNTQGLVIKRTCVSLNNNTNNIVKVTTATLKMVSVKITISTMKMINTRIIISVKIMTSIIKMTTNTSKIIFIIGKVILGVDRAKRKA